MEKINCPAGKSEGLTASDITENFSDAVQEQKILIKR